MTRGRPPRFQPETVSPQPTDVQALLDQLDGGGPTTDPFADAMETAPRDGSRVWLIDGNAEHPAVLAYWRTPRSYIPGVGWREVGAWYIWKGSQALGFEPVGWYDDAA